MSPLTRPDAAGIDPDVYLRERYQRTSLRHATLAAYYAARPLVPRATQLAARRAYARIQERRSFPAWPIEPLLVEHRYAQLRRRIRDADTDAVPLVGYWPDGCRFAFMLTHDVESAKGIERIPELLELERRYGMVSCWNFVAEDYPIPAETFELIREAGGEVGLHGVHHDGRLFQSRRSFEAALPSLRYHAAAWDAVGFRSPGTHRNAEWMPLLPSLYDSSFPDTDPFEPYPGGCCSILPYFLGDLVELPITLAQDHTLWEILRLSSIAIWRRKADWLIAHHGLVSVIIHPDYVDSGARLGLYEQLLAYLRERLDENDGWHALPRDVAAWWRARRDLHIETVGGMAWIEGPEDYADRATVTWARGLGESVFLHA
jgi:hypothetical protein